MTPEERDQAAHEFNAKFEKNQAIVGYGMATSVQMPCPFCAEPGFVDYRVVDVARAMEEEIVCKACKRGMCTITKRDGDSIQMEFVQTRGDDLPEFMPKLRRMPEPTLENYKKAWAAWQAELNMDGPRDVWRGPTLERETKWLWMAITPEERRAYILEQNPLMEES